MQPSAERILTTHAGSLPKPEALLSEVYAQERGEAVDAGKLAADTHAAVEETVRRQLEAGVDVVNDGEVAKPSFATYVKDRLTGFGGESTIEQALSQVLDLGEFPDFAERMPAMATALSGVRYAACDGPVSFVGADAVQADIDNLRDAVAGADGRAPAGMFMSAASPGVISVYAPNRYYPTEGDYLEAVAEAMRPEYEAIHRAGMVLQIDCPDLAMTAPSAESLQSFRDQIEQRVEALNHALVDIPAEAARVHLCWGNGATPRTCDVELKDIIDIVLKAKPAGLMLMAANGRHAHEWAVFEDVKLPDGKYVIPGVLDPTTNIVEHPEAVAQRLVQYADVVGRENVMAGTDCGFGTIAGVTLTAPSVVWAKLRTMAEGARLATRRLWR